MDRVRYGVILSASRYYFRAVTGGGVFMKYLPANTEWCEIAEGRDFFAYDKQVDWIIGNPPFKLFYEFMEHSYKVAKDIVYLLPADKPFNVFATVLMIFKYGGIVHARFYGNGQSIGIPEIHRPVTAFHFQRGYRGAMSFSFAEPRLTKRPPDGATRAAQKGSISGKRSVGSPRR